MIIKNRDFFLFAHRNYDSNNRKIPAKKENLNEKRSTVEIKKTARTLSYEESQKRGKDCSL